MTTNPASSLRRPADVRRARLTYPAPAAAQSRRVTPADSAGITRTALDYIEGWYTGDATRMERALHPELAKRIMFRPTRRDARHGSISRAP